ncbi:MAG: hypothetical protein QXI16_00355 [Sulfolobaceae archaeon]|nr:hypothetical protein [Candidatus Jingweiarchaeum tengchongense]
MTKKYLIFLTIFIFASLLLFANSENKQFIKICPSGFYFELNGKVFIPIGFNYGVDWPDFSNLWTGDVGGLKWGDPESVESTFKEWHMYGVNTLRIFMEDASDPSGSALFEDPLGNVNESLVKVWNYIFEYAKKYDIYLIIEPFDPFWMSRNWAESPFNIKNGGPIDSLAQFLESPKTIEDTEFRFKFFIDHWGNTSHILAWEINNEIDLWYGSNNTDAISKYIKTISDFIKNYEDSKFGQHHLITVSTATPVLFNNLGKTIYKNKHLDFVTTHLYLPAVSNPTNTINPAIEVSQAVIENLENMNYSKPYIDSEDGPINGWSLPMTENEEYHHNMLWAEFASGACGPGLKWPYLSPVNITGLDTYKAISNFINSPGIDWLYFKAFPESHNITISGTAKNYVIPFSCGDNNARILWILKNSTRDLKNIDFSKVDLIVSNLENGTYDVELWNTHDGTLLKVIKLLSQKNKIELNLNMDNLNDIALKIYKISN